MRPKMKTIVQPTRHNPHPYLTIFNPAALTSTLGVRTVLNLHGVDGVTAPLKPSTQPGGRQHKNENAIQVKGYVKK